MSIDHSIVGFQEENPNTIYYLQKMENSEMTITEEVIQKVLPACQTDLYRSSCLKIWQGLSNKEREFLLAMAETGNDKVKSGDIVAGMHKPKNYVSACRLRLLDTQVIGAPEHGHVQFTLPYFRNFILDTRDLLL